MYTQIASSNILYSSIYYIVDRTDSALFHAAIIISIRATVKTLTIDLNNNNNNNTHRNTYIVVIGDNSLYTYTYLTCTQYSIILYTQYTHSVIHSLIRV